MCQTNNIQKRFTAGTVCYKVLRKNPVYGYRSMYQKMFWEREQIYKTSFYNLSISQIESYYPSFDRIEFGFFHAFPTLGEAKRFQKTLCSGLSYSRFVSQILMDFPIAEMRIPEDVVGFSGKYFDRDEVFDSITVPILEFVKIVDQNVSI